VELLEPTKFVAKLQEPAVVVDPTSGSAMSSFPRTTPTRPMATSQRRWSTSTTASGRLRTARAARYFR